MHVEMDSKVKQTLYNTIKDKTATYENHLLNQSKCVHQSQV